MDTQVCGWVDFGLGCQESCCSIVVGCGLALLGFRWWLLSFFCLDCVLGCWIMVVVEWLVAMGCAMGCCGWVPWLLSYWLCHGDWLYVKIRDEIIMHC